MLLVLKPLVMTMWRSRAFKELIIAMLERIVTRTDNDLDDLAVKHLKDLLLPDTRVEKWVASGIIQVILLLLAMGLALLPFFQFFRGTPHQLAAIKQLEESMPAELLEEHEADWFQAWKERIRPASLHAVLQATRQRDWNGISRVFQFSGAMVAAFYKKVRTDDEYNKIRAKYGDTTSVEAQLAALRSLGLQAEFRKDGDADMVELEIEAGRPVLAGYLSAGNMLRGEPQCAAAWVADTGWSLAGSQGRTATTQSGSSKTLVAIPKWRRVVTAIRIWGVTSV